MIYTEMTKKAMTIAHRAHLNQVDKAGFPYIHHPLHLAESMLDEKSTCVALLHDVVEDSDYTFEDLINEGFDDDIIEALKLLTHNDGSEYFTYVKRIKTNDIARSVKLADLKHNSDLSRLSVVSAESLIRQKKYLEAIRILSE